VGSAVDMLKLKGSIDIDDAWLMLTTKLWKDDEAMAALDVVRDEFFRLWTSKNELEKYKRRKKNGRR